MILEFIDRYTANCNQADLTVLIARTPDGIFSVYAPTILKTANGHGVKHYYAFEVEQKISKEGKIHWKRVYLSPHLRGRKRSGYKYNRIKDF